MARLKQGTAGKKQGPPDKIGAAEFKKALRQWSEKAEPDRTRRFCDLGRRPPKK